MYCRLRPKPGCHQAAGQICRFGHVFVEVVRLVVVLLATAGGFSLGKHGPGTDGSVIVGAVLGALSGYVGGGLLGRILSTTRDRVEERVQRLPAAQLFAGAVGAARA